MKKFLKIFIILVVVGVILGVYYVCTNVLFNLPKIEDNNNKKSNNKDDDKEEVSTDLFGDYYKKAGDIVSKMSLEEKVGQLFLVRYDSEAVETQLSSYYPGGYILFAKDFQNKTKSSIKEELDNVQANSKNPLIIGVDEEGGTVTRVSRFTNFRSSKFDSPQNIYNQGGYDLLESMENEKAKLLLNIGINFNLAPVADVSTNSNDFIYSRSFGKSASETATYVSNMIIYANSEGISSCLKHFPGYGNNVDTHTGIAIDDRSYDNFTSNDFLPFESGIEVNVPTILVSHNIVKTMDENYPASLSEKVHTILRNYLGFSGVVITDDLAMDAIKSYVSNGKAATLAINAGNDMIITSNFETMRNEVINSIKNEKISMDDINMAAKRVIAWKMAYGLY